MGDRFNNDVLLLLKIISASYHTVLPSIYQLHKLSFASDVSGSELHTNYSPVQLIHNQELQE